MRAERTLYEVPGWGVGELWTSAQLVVSHEIDFEPVSDTGGATLASSSAVDATAAHSSRRAFSRAAVDSVRGAVGTPSTRVSLDRTRCLTPHELVELLNAFLGGADVPLAEVPLDLAWTTPFQRAVVSVLRTIPRGEVVTYGELAALAGYPGAQRAAGTFCARNRFMLLLPCHRIVGAAGIGGYGSAGVGVKRRLLALEGVVL
jgi:methylated-DNA-[protein]-cysteine S-methyltransferase